jgi:hypothetical protein
MKFFSNISGKFCRNDHVILSLSFPRFQFNLFSLADKYPNTIYFENPTPIPEQFMKNNLKINEIDLPALKSIVLSRSFNSAK